MMHKTLEIIGALTVMLSIVVALAFALGHIIVKIMDDTHESRD